MTESESVRCTTQRKEGKEDYNGSVSLLPVSVQSILFTNFSRFFLYYLMQAYSVLYQFDAVELRSKICVGSMYCSSVPKKGTLLLYLILSS